MQPKQPTTTRTTRRKQPLPYIGIPNGSPRKKNQPALAYVGIPNGSPPRKKQPPLAYVGIPVGSTKTTKAPLVADPAALPDLSPAGREAAFKTLPVRQRQQILRNAGFQVTVDGVAGPQTATATRAYLKGVSPAIWNHAWQTTTPQPAPTTQPAPVPVEPQPAPAVTGGNAALLDDVLGGIGSYKPPTTKQLMQQAKQLAGLQLNPQEQLLTSQENRATAQAQAAATLQGELGKALANIVAGIGPEVQDTYHQAGQDTAALASGFSSGLRSTADADAQKINSLLDALGAPAAQHIGTGKTDDLADVLYGLGGYIPGNALAREGAAFTSAADMLPATATGQGAQLAQQEIATGQKNVQTLADQLASLEAQRPGLVQNALSQVEDAATKNEAAAQNSALLPLMLAGKFDALPGVNPLTGQKTSKQATIDNETRNAQLRAQSLGLTEAKLKTSLAEDLQKQKTSGKRLGLSAKDWQTYNSKALSLARIGHKPTATGEPPVGWQKYLDTGLAQGIPISILIKQGKKVYTRREIKLGLIPGSPSDGG